MTNIVKFHAKHPPAIKKFSVGDTFTTQDGIRVHVLQERQTEDGRQFLYAGGGLRVWAADTRFVRAS
jgi:hypothetical protein